MAFPALFTNEEPAQSSLALMSGVSMNSYKYIHNTQFCNVHFDIFPPVSVVKLDVLT